MLVGFEGLFGLLVIAFWIWAIIDCISTDAQQCRGLPKVAWLIIVVLLLDLGAILWLLLGRPKNGRVRAAGSTADSPRTSHPRAAVDRSGSGPGSGSGSDISDRRSAELDQQLAAWEAQRDEIALHQRELDEREQGRDSP